MPGLERSKPWWTLKEYADRLKFEIVRADFLTTEGREMVFDLIEKVLGDDNA